eukprot:symbB.v1.2.023577.t1/scaffold2167.1/size87172/4
MLMSLLLPDAIAALDPRQQVTAAMQKLEELTDPEIYKKVASGGGDNIRREVGTVGMTSPLFDVDKAFKALAEDADDPETYVETLERFTKGMTNADADAYSSIFSMNSAAATSPQVYIDKAFEELKVAKDAARELTKIDQHLFTSKSAPLVDAASLIMVSDVDLWFARHLRPEVPRLCLGAGALVLSSFVNFRTGAQLKAAIEEGGKSSAFRSLMLFGLGAAAGCVRTIIFDSASERLRTSMSVEVFAAKLLEEPSQSSEEGSCSVAAMDSDVALCADFILKLQNVARFTSSIVGGTVAMFRASWKLSAAVWPLLVIGAVQGARAGAKRSMKSAQTLAQVREDALSFAEERLQHSDLVRWFCRAEEEAKAFHEKCEKTVAVATSSAKRRGIAHFVLDWASKGVLLGLSSFGSQLVARGELTAGQLTSYFFHATFLGLGLYGLVGLVPEIVAARAAALRLNSITKVAKTAQSVTPNGSSLLCGEKALPINFKDVHFRYEDQEVLQGFSLQLAAGE